MEMDTPDVNEIRKQLSDLDLHLAKLAALQSRPRPDFDHDPPLRKAVESSLGAAARASAAVCGRIIAVQGAQPPLDDYQALMRMGELGVLTPQAARQLAPFANVHNVIKQAYLNMKWDEVYQQLQNLDDLKKFREAVSAWMQK